MSSTTGRVFGASITRRSPDALWLAAPGILFLAVLLVLPCARMLMASVEDPHTGALSLASFSRLLSVPNYVRVLSSTFAIAIETTLLCLLFGYPLAYWLAKQPVGRRARLTLLVLFPFWTSALVKSFVWIVLLGQAGPVGQLFELFGAAPPDLLFSRPTVVLAMTHTMLPLAIVTMLPTLVGLDPSLPRAAETMGATGAEAFWRISFPSSMPGVAAAGLLVFIASLGFFITPALLGSPRDTMLGQLIIQQVMNLQAWSFAGALGTMLIASALVSCLIYDFLFGLSSLGGDSHRGTARRWPQRLGILAVCQMARLAAGLSKLAGGRRCGWLLTAYSLLALALLLTPILACVPMAFTSSTFLSFPPPSYSLRWFETYFASEPWMAATLNSFAVGFGSACLTIVIAAPAALGIARSRSRMSSAMFLLFLSPLIVPHVVLAVGLFYLFAAAGLVATNFGIMLGHTVIATPLAVVILLTQLRSYDWRLNQAAETMGASRFHTARRVMAPLVKGGLIAAFIFAFLSSFEELTVALFIGGGVRVTLPRQMWDDINLQVTPTLAAASMVVLLVVGLLFGLAERLRPAR